VHHKVSFSEGSAFLMFENNMTFSYFQAVKGRFLKKCSKLTLSS